ncbi:catalase [Sclerotinia borealis F-4128]|uniref:Catalase n=1 Tax=Sclerotinia borealis (strain F-4128) TaxID=1432307 RepID=W9CHS5_SCLBF|nr:catalase [Sclerotinia borealis F-4128]
MQDPKKTQPIYTTSNGRPMTKPEGSQRAGSHLLLQDFHLIDLLSHFNRERIPERVVHAKGAGAFGEFEVTHDISDICSIDMLLGIGKKTKCLTRFSTSAGERGAADSQRDPRGFSVKMYTEEGNWDWVYNSVPFFFIRDPIKFPAMIHAVKRDPRTNLPNPNSFWDWVTSNQESLHMIMWLFSEYGTFTSYRHMNGYQANVHKWTMPDGSFKYVHMYLQADLGYKFHTDDEIPHLAGTDPDHATRDLSEAIDAGNFPTYTAYVQVLDPADAPNIGYNIFDMTKHWDMGTYPKDLGHIGAIPFGKMTLNRNPDNYFAEIEQAAFSPSHLVPGIEPSADPMLQARMFAYPDTQRYRLGVNYQQIPVNRPLHAFNPLLRDGAANCDNYGSYPGYPTDSKPMHYTPTYADPAHEEWVGRMTSDPFLEVTDVDYKFARTFWEHLAWEDQFKGWQEKLPGNVAANLSGAGKEVRERAYKMFGKLTKELEEKIREATEKLVVEKAKENGMEQVEQVEKMENGVGGEKPNLLFTNGSVNGNGNGIATNGNGSVYGNGNGSATNGILNGNGNGNGTKSHNHNHNHENTFLITTNGDALSPATNGNGVVHDKFANGNGSGNGIGNGNGNVNGSSDVAAIDIDAKKVVGTLVAI